MDEISFSLMKNFFLIGRIDAVFEFRESGILWSLNFCVKDYCIHLSSDPDLAYDSVLTASLRFADLNNTKSNSGIFHKVEKNIEKIYLFYIPGQGRDICCGIRLNFLDGGFLRIFGGAYTGSLALESNVLDVADHDAEFEESDDRLRVVCVFDGEWIE